MPDLDFVTDQSVWIKQALPLKLFYPLFQHSFIPYSSSFKVLVRDGFALDCSITNFIKVSSVTCCSALISQLH